MFKWSKDNYKHCYRGHFFDIKLKDKNLIDSYIDKFNPESYDVITKQSFDSTKKHEFIRLYFKTHKE